MASFFQKLGRGSHLKTNPSLIPSSPGASATVNDDSTPSPAISSPSTPVRKDVKYKTVTVTRQVQRSSNSTPTYYQNSGQVDILKRLNKRKKDRIMKSEKVEREKKPPKEAKEKGSKRKRGRKAKSNEFVTSEQDESEEEDYEEEEEGDADEEEEEEEDENDNAQGDNSDEVKKAKRTKTQAIESRRVILLSSIFAKCDEVPKILHSADVANDTTPGYNSLIPDEEDGDDIVELKYPGIENFAERFSLVAPSKDDYDPLSEMQNIMKLVAKFYLEEEDSLQVFAADLQDCIIRRINRAIKRKSLYALKTAVEEYNAEISRLHEEDKYDSYKQLIETKLHIRKNMTELSHEILGQIYSRIVSPYVHELRKYTAFSSNVYGELLPSFTSKIFEELEITSEHVFTDLGSGVGNCVLQAALEVGCESYGCEMMEKAAALGDKQHAEFTQRLKLWGIQAGPVKLITGDFVKSDEISDILKRTDFLLVNNYAFDAELNGSLVNMFLDMRDGAKIVSLKSFVPPGHTITSHNVESPINMLKVEEREFFSGSVSWTDAPGKYYISTMDRSRVSKFLSSVESSA